MKVLLVTEKCSQSETEKDGGARLVETMQRAFGDSLAIMQFGPKADPSATWHFDYPSKRVDRFERRLANAKFIAEQVKRVEQDFTHVIFIHISMQFGLVDLPLREGIQIWTFPMFLTPSYRVSGEVVPERYFEKEYLTLASSKHILTPSHLEKRQLVEFYAVPEEQIDVIPRGINTYLLNPKVRSLSMPLIFCSIGSIKPQKNTLGLVRLFAKVRARFPGAKLRIIGAIQNSKYFENVYAEIEHLGLKEVVELAGYILPSELALAIQDAHLHLSASMCETFGRSIFETLASGLPNIARKTGNAAAEFLENLPYARFVDDDSEALNLIEEMIGNLPKLSAMALEIGHLYDDELLSRFIVAKIYEKNFIAISDFDGTLYHKNDPEKTARCFEAFRKFPLRIICSARPIHDLLEQLRFYNLEVDWIIGCSGSIVTNGCGKRLWLSSLSLNDVAYLEELLPQAKRIEMEGEVLQIAVPVGLYPNNLKNWEFDKEAPQIFCSEEATIAEGQGASENKKSELRPTQSKTNSSSYLGILPNLFGFRVETYQDTAFIAHWQASKLRAVHRLLRYIDWSGQVCAFGDGIYDSELLTYFDGTLITPFPKNKFQKKEIGHV